MMNVRLLSTDRSSLACLQSSGLGPGTSLLVTQKAVQRESVLEASSAEGPPYVAMMLKSRSTQDCWGLHYTGRNV